MKSKSLVGWVYPCEFYKAIDKKFGIIGVNENLPPVDSRKDLLGENCLCQKHCKPIKIRLTIEKV